MNSVLFIILSVSTLLCIFLVIYHHVLYPSLIPHLAKQKKSIENKNLNSDKQKFNNITIVMPAYNEATTIRDKLYNLGSLDYPHNKLKVIILLDGCTDNTAEIINMTCKDPLFSDLDIEVNQFPENAGKIKRINEAIEKTQSELVVFTDVSALISHDALLIANQNFQDETIGVVTGYYRLLTPGSDGEALYWRQQSRQQQAESQLGAIQGAHGAFYVIRRNLFKPLSLDTINDDFVIPMQIVASGYRAIMDININALELEQTTPLQEASRRKRIAAGNMQQLIRLRSMLNPRYGSLAFMFASGKSLRVAMPYCMLIAFMGSVFLANESMLFATALCAQTIGYGTGMLSLTTSPLFHRFSPIGYLIKGHYYNFIGSTRYLLDAITGRKRFTMQHSASIKTSEQWNSPTAAAKRFFDVTVASAALMILLPLFPFIGLAIKIESRGPAIFSQVRIGRCTASQTQFFTMYKFRSMVANAEKTTGATLATKNDARVTRVGKLLRKTRLDELPQLINVIRGDMSIVGPRPERPDFYGKLENAIPFFTERTYGVLPGITGLAQVHQGYDTCIEDVRSKVGYDHSYALALHNLGSWLKMDTWIMLKTITVMITGRGQ